MKKAIGEVRSNYNQKMYDILGLFKAYGRWAFILRSQESEEYSYLTSNLSGFCNLYSLFSKYAPSEISWESFSTEEDEDFIKNMLFDYNEQYNFQVEYDMEDQWVGRFLNKDNTPVQYWKIKDFSVDGSISIGNGQFLIEDISKYKNKRITERIEKLYSNEDPEELRTILPYYSDYIIVKNLNRPLYIDFLGTLRFQEMELTEQEKIWRKDLNNTWMEYHNDKITFNQLIMFYTKFGYSVNGFMEVFYDFFSEYDDELDETIPKQEDEIIKIINS